MSESLKQFARDFLTWHANHFNDFDADSNSQLLCLANDAEGALLTSGLSSHLKWYSVSQIRPGHEARHIATVHQLNPSIAAWVVAHCHGIPVTQLIADECIDCIDRRD